jgi:hypothetical protein
VQGAHGQPGSNGVDGQPVSFTIVRNMTDVC